MPAFGLSGPWRDNVGFAQTMEQVTGLAWITGHTDDQPRIQRGPSDPNAGMHAAFAMLVGFAEREATGRGCLLEVTMVEGALERRRRARAGSDRLRQPARTRRQPQPQRRAAGPVRVPRRRPVAGDLGRHRRAVARARARARLARVGRRSRAGGVRGGAGPVTTSSTTTSRSGAPSAIPARPPSSSSRTACPPASGGTRARCSTIRS